MASMIEKSFRYLSFKINAFAISIRKDVRVDKHLGYHSELYEVAER
jgi:hypothetical protein